MLHEYPDINPEIESLRPRRGPPSSSPYRSTVRELPAFGKGNRSRWSLRNRPCAFRVQDHRVACLAKRERHFHEYSQEFSFLYRVAGHAAFRPKWGDKGNDHSQPRIGQKLRDLGHAADVLDPVALGEAKIRLSPDPDGIPVLEKCSPDPRMELLFHAVGDSRFPGPDRPGHP